MNIPTKKLHFGFEMPVYGLGTWLMGGRTERDSDNDDAADIAAIRSAIEHGVTHIDTAKIDIIKESAGVVTGVECKWSEKKGGAPPLWKETYPTASFLTITPENCRDHIPG